MTLTVARSRLLPASPRVHRARARGVRRAQNVSVERAGITARQVSGEGEELVRRLRRCAEVTSESFGRSRSDAPAVLDALVRKVRHSGPSFALVEAVEGDTEVVCGCADVTTLPASGSRASREPLVARVPQALGLTESGAFAYVSGMCVLPSYRKRGAGRALLEACEACARRMTPRPSAVALHVESDNEGAIALYESCGYVRVIEREVDDAFGRMSRALGGLVGGGGKKRILMTRDLPHDEAVANEADAWIGAHRERIDG